MNRTSTLITSFVLIVAFVALIFALRQGNNLFGVNPTTSGVENLQAESANSEFSSHSAEVNLSDSSNQQFLLLPNSKVFKDSCHP